MRGNRPARERFEFSLDARQVAAVLLGSLGALGITFYLGYAVGQRIQERGGARAAPGRTAAPAPPPSDPLAALDRGPRPDGGEPPPKLSFHEALTGPRPAAEKLPAPKGTPAPGPAPDVAAAARGPEPKGAPAQPPRPPEARPAELAPAAKGEAPSAVPPAGEARGAAPPPTPAAASASAAEVPAPAKGASAPKVAVPKASAAAKGAAPRPGEPAAAAPVPQEGAFAIQVGSTQDRFEAERIAARFRARGARVVASDVPGKGRWFRVKVGGYETREAAEQALREIERGGAKGFVTTAN
jgi:cell division septation protein DedD